MNLKSIEESNREHENPKQTRTHSGCHMWYRKKHLIPHARDVNIYRQPAVICQDAAPAHPATRLHGMKQR